MKISEMIDANGWGYKKRKQANGLTAYASKVHFFKDNKSLCGHVEFDKYTEKFTLTKIPKKCGNCIHIQKAWPSIYGTITS